MPIQTEKELSDNARALWLKSLHAVELRNYGYAISLIQAILKEFPAFLEGRKRLRKVEFLNTKGKKSFLSGLSTASLKGAGMIKKDPMAAIELAEKNLENDPGNAQINHLLKEAAKAAGLPEVACFALETIIEENPKDTKTMHELGESDPEPVGAPSGGGGEGEFREGGDRGPRREGGGGGGGGRGGDRGPRREGGGGGGGGRDRGPRREGGGGGDRGPRREGGGGGGDRPPRND